MSNARNLADIVTGNFDVPLGALDNVPPSNDASALTTGTLPVGRLPSSGVSASSLTTGTLATPRLPSGTIVKLQHDYSGSVASVTNGNMTFYQANAFTKTAFTNPVMVTGHMMWGGDNPNGWWSLEYSDNGTNWYTCADVYEADEIGGGLGNVNVFNFAFRDTNNYTTRSYRIYWYHYATNGGTMYRNRPYTLQSWSGAGKGKSGFTIYEEQA